MATAGLAGQAKELQEGPEQLMAEMEREVAEILQDAGLGSGLGRNETAGWYYWMPFPGTRYYLYSQWPPPVEQAKRPPLGVPAQGG
jgi:hypothetical protein